MIAFIDAHREVIGVEPICHVLPIAPATCHARAASARNPVLASDRARQDAKDFEKIRRVHDKNKGRHDGRMIWHRFRRGEYDIALHSGAPHARTWVARGCTGQEEDHDP